MLNNQSINLFVLILITLLAAGCSTNPSSSAPKLAQQTALNFQPEADKAVLYLYRPYVVTNSGVSSSFRVNEQRLGELYSGYFRVGLRPGKHLIRKFFPSSYEAEFYEEHKEMKHLKPLMISARAGEIIFVRFTQDYVMKKVSTAQGKAEIRDLTLFQSGFSYMDKVHLTKEDYAWQTCDQAGTIKSCQQFLSHYPDSDYRAKADEKIQYFHAIEARKKVVKAESKFAATFERDRGLPVEVRRDKYMLALTTHLKNERYQETMRYFRGLERLDTKLVSSFYYFYGEALLKTDDPEGAITKLYKYISEVGSKGKYYKRALELVNKAESDNF